MRLFCQDHPDTYELAATVIDARSGAVLVDRSPFFPGGGGQLADKGTLIATSGAERTITRITADDRGAWLDIADADSIRDDVLLRVDAPFRNLMRELHTLAHVANSVVFTGFGGALLTGAQLGDDGTMRIDFDLPDADNDRLRAMEGPINDILRQNVTINTLYISRSEAEATPGMFRSKSVAPPAQPDGLVRVVEIEGLDRQACGGTHLTSTGASRPCRILKIENKGRHNRRMRLALVE
jgi:misacylated tRNA(Ala) deacylase